MNEGGVQMSITRFVLACGVGACLAAGAAGPADGSEVRDNAATIDGGEFGVVYRCGFGPGNTVVLDGDLTDLAWGAAPWHFVDHKTGTGPAPNNDNASFQFAAVADDEWLYVAIDVTDDEMQNVEQSGPDVWQDDSVEVYIDANHGETDAYENDEGSWDTQISIGAENIGREPDAPILGGMGKAQTPELTQRWSSPPRDTSSKRVFPSIRQGSGISSWRMAWSSGSMST